jgi:hypothetical protein
MKKPDEQSGIIIKGFLKIFDPINKMVFFNGCNAIHYENMSIALAESLANAGQGFIYEMAFGNGGTTVDPTGVITYLTPNSSGTNSSLYNQTYSKVVDDRSTNNIDPTRNKIETRHIAGTSYTDILVSCLLDFGEPADQDAFDNASYADSQYVFDEIGLKSYSPAGNGRLLTHVVFHPVQKSLNRMIQIDYTVRVQSLTGYTEE